MHVKKSGTVRLAVIKPGLQGSTLALGPDITAPLIARKESQNYV
jgi:hypothetical protein